MFTKKEKELINDAILEERERIKKIIRDNILHNLVPKRVDYTTTISIDKFIQNLNDRIDNKPDREKCKTCDVALVCGGGCASVAKNKNGNTNSPDCRPIKELLSLGAKAYLAP